MGCTGPNQAVEDSKAAVEFAMSLGLSKKKCEVLREKRMETIRKKRKDLSNYFKQEHMDIAMSKTEDILKDEKYVSIMDTLNELFEKIKNKINSLTGSKECPIALRPPLDSVIYASTRLNIEELNQLREKISQMYGSDYIKKASNNEDQIVNQELIKKLNENTFSKEIIKNRLVAFINEEKVIRASRASKQSSINPSVNKQSIEQSKKNNESNIKRSEDKTNQKSVKSTTNGVKTAESSNQGQTSNTNDPPKDTVPIDILKLLDDKNYNPFDQKTVKTLNLDEQNVQQPQNGEKNNVDLLDQPTYKTMHISVANPDNKENPFEGDIRDINNKGKEVDIFDKDAKVKDPFDVETIKLGDINDNKRQEEIKEFDPEKMPNPLDIPTLKIDEMPIIVSKEGADPFDKNAKVEDPFNCPTLKEDEINMQKEGADPFDKNAKVEDPFNCPTLKEDEIDIKG